VFNGTWQYTAPIGAPQDGAYHCTSADGLVFTQTANLASDNTHNWTGNLLADGSSLRFYGSGPLIWYNSSADGLTWNGFINTNIGGGDPGIVKLSTGSYIMIYVGPNVITNTSNPVTNSPIRLYPNPVSNLLTIQGKTGKKYPYSLYNAAGSLLRKAEFTGSASLDLGGLAAGVYLLVTEENKILYCSRLIKQ
jgi:hypothetical protein